MPIKIRILLLKTYVDNNTHGNQHNTNRNPEFKTLAFFGVEGSKIGLIYLCIDNSKKLPTGEERRHNQVKFANVLN